METKDEDQTKHNPIHEAVVFYWGERCPDYEADCPTCGAWKFYDKLTGESHGMETM